MRGPYHVGKTDTSGLPINLGVAEFQPGIAKDHVILRPNIGNFEGEAKTERWVIWRFDPQRNVMGDGSSLVCGSISVSNRYWIKYFIQKDIVSVHEIMTDKIASSSRIN